MTFVIRRKSDGKFLQGRATWRQRWVDDLAKARTFGRRCDASNSTANSPDTEVLACRLVLEEPKETP